MIRYITRLILVASFIAVPRLAAADDPPATASAPSTRLSPSTGVLERVQLYEQLQRLHLTAAQAKQIVMPLWRVLDAERQYHEAQEKAAGPIAESLARMEKALLAGQPVAETDQAALAGAARPVDVKESAWKQLQQQAIQAVRLTLTGPQIETLHAIVGITLPAVRELTPGPGAGPAGGGPGGGPPSGGGAGPGGGGFSAEQMSHIIDHFRRMPMQDWNELQDNAAHGNVQMNFNGVLVTSPEYKAANNGVSFFDQMQQIRDMPDELFQQRKDEIASSLGQQWQAFNEAHPDLAPPGPAAVTAAADQLTAEAIRRLFFQPNAYRYVRARGGFQP